jgi:hypothetical protein
MMISYSIRLDCTKKAVALQTALAVMAGVQRVRIKKGNITIIYENSVTDARHIREKIMQKGFLPTNEIKGGTFERMGDILVVYQRERQLYL